LFYSPAKFANILLSCLNFSTFRDIQIKAQCLFIYIDTDGSGIETF